MITLFSFLRSKVRLLFSYFAFLCIGFAGLSSQFVLASSASAQEYILLMTSSRNAQTVADAAQVFHQRYPNLAIKARTERQISELRARDPQALVSLLNQSQAIIAMGLFGPVVAELEPILKTLKPNKPRWIFNADHKLIAQSMGLRGAVFDEQASVSTLAKMRPDGEFDAWLAQLIKTYPAQKDWLLARSYWQAGGSENTAELMAWAWAHVKPDADVQVVPATATARLRWANINEAGQYRVQNTLPTLNKQPVVAIVDHPGGGRSADAKILKHLCQRLAQQNQQCLVALAYWGQAGVEAVSALKQLNAPLSSVVMLQDFVIGGGEGREQVSQLFEQLNVPVVKAIKLRDRDQAEYMLSSDGLAQDKVYYQVAMPELQGASQPLVMATAGAVSIDEISGIRIQPIVDLSSGSEALLGRLARWQQLQDKANQDKRVAIIYYNHPPGRHNIGADNLDVPASLWQILQQLKAAGYNTGELPESQQALLDLMQAKAVNLPNDKAALEAMQSQIVKLDTPTYQAWFAQLPETVKREMQFGPFGLLHSQIKAALAADAAHLAQHALDHTFEEMHHLLEGVDHPARKRALHLVEELEVCYLAAVKQQKGTACFSEAEKLISALQQTGIEGLGGWGAPPGRVMTWENQLLVPGLQFGNIFIGPQPPRGWEINEELLHANLAFPPPHQYLAFYHYLKDDFKADAFVHLGRHSTYEFLPRRSVGLAEDDYARIIAADIPGVYPYIVDGVGEGIQAKRRGLAVMVDHLTPPLQSTPLYDELLQLRQLIESFEASHGSGNKAVEQRLLTQILEKVDALELKDELAEAMSAELAVMGISFDEVDDDMMVHEVGHYLTDLQERFMPLGLHVFGRDWQAQAIDMMLTSMAPESDEQKANWQALLSRSPAAEMQSLLNGLSGGFVAPGQGNDPIRSPSSLPTGRNFYALDSSLIPSRVAWELGQELAQSARANNPQDKDKREALILWASDVVRDEGVMIAFGLDMLGLEPVWNSRGLVKGLKHQTLSKERVRRDVVFTTSGLFRDLYASQIRLINHATLHALDASRERIMADYPALSLALQAALAPLHDEQNAVYKSQHAGTESLSQNQVAAHWVKQAQALLAAKFKPEQAGLIATYRVFGDAPGSYGAGINRLAERSGAWEKRSELADVYTRRIGHAYSLLDDEKQQAGFGVPAQKVFTALLADVDNTYFGRSSNLYGLIDNNDAFDYLGGLSLAVEMASGKVPNNFVIDHADPNKVKTSPLSLALRQELRGRFLNPAWLKGLMEHDYAGARTMGSEFLEYLWGWQVTNPGLVGDWAWEEVKAVYMDDKYELGLDAFLAEGHNAHVKANMLAIMLVAVQKEFWQADEATIADLAQQFVALVAQNGLPGSGHTDPNHPMLPWLESHLSQEQWQQLEQVIESAKQTEPEAQEIHRLSEVHLEQAQAASEAEPSPQEQAPNEASESEPADEQADDQEQPENTWLRWLLLTLAVLAVAGFAQGIYQTRRTLEKHS